MQTLQIWRLLAFSSIKSHSYLCFPHYKLHNYVFGALFYSKDYLYSKLWTISFIFCWSFFFLTFFLLSKKKIFFFFLSSIKSCSNLLSPFKEAHVFHCSFYLFLFYWTLHKTFIWTQCPVYLIYTNYLTKIHTNIFLIIIMIVDMYFFWNSTTVVWLYCKQWFKKNF